MLCRRSELLQMQGMSKLLHPDDWSVTQLFYAYELASLSSNCKLIGNANGTIWKISLARDSYYKASDKAENNDVHCAV